MTLPADNSRHTAFQTTIQSASAFREDLDACRAAGVFDVDFEERVIPLVGNVANRLEDRLLGHRVAVYRLKKIPFFRGQAICRELVCHIAPVMILVIRVLAFILRSEIRSKEITRMPVRVQVFSDYTCPYCLLGEVPLRKAVEVT